MILIFDTMIPDKICQGSVFLVSHCRHFSSQETHPPVLCRCLLVHVTRSSVINLISATETETAEPE